MKTCQLIDNIISSASLNREKKNFQFYRGRNMKPFYLDPKHFNELKNLIADHMLYDLEQGEKDEDEFCLKRTFYEKHKLMIDIDACHKDKIANPLHEFADITINIAKLAESKDFKLFSRKPYFDNEHQVWKFGAHACFYDTIIEPCQNHYDVIMNNDKIKESIKSLQDKGFTIDIDKCAFSRNGIGLIGSRKAGSHQYLEIMLTEPDGSAHSICDFDKVEHANLRTLSNVTKEILLQQIDLLFPDDYCHEWLETTIKPFELSPDIINKLPSVANNNNKQITNNKQIACENLNVYINLIDPKYFEDYNDWIRLGTAIKNAGGTVQMFDEMSQKGKSYRDYNDCLTKWNSFKDSYSGQRGPATIGTIKYYAKLSDPKAYNELNQNVAVNSEIDWIIYHQEDINIAEWILNQKSGKIFDLINSVFVLCDKENNKTSRSCRWFKFNGVYHKQINEIYLMKEIFDTITKMLINEIFENQQILKEAEKEFKDLEEKIKQGTSAKRSFERSSNNLAQEYLVVCAEDKKAEIESYIVLAKKLKSSINTSKLRNAVIPYLQHSLMKPMAEFIEEFNDYKGLVTFENCIYDAVNKTIIKDNDLYKNTMSTKLIYNPMPSVDNIKIFTEKIMGPIFTDDRIRNFMYKILAKLLTSDKMQYFLLFNGRGSNGKSLLVRMLTNMLGDYSINVQQTFLTRASHKGQADSDMADALHKRVITVNEPASDSILSADIIKTISGNDTINARGLFKDPIRYKPFGKLIITCNDVPQFSEFTDALKRRLINVRFESRFLDKYNYDIENAKDEFNIYLIDESLENVIKDKTFLSDVASWLLQEYYDESDVFDIPDPCKIAANELFNEQDIYKEFVDTYLEKTDDNNEVVDLKDLYNQYKYFMQDNYPNEKIDSRSKGFYNGLRRHGLKFRNGPNAFITGFKINIV